MEPIATTITSAKGPWVMKVSRTARRDRTLLNAMSSFVPGERVHNKFMEDACVRDCNQALPRNESRRQESLAVHGLGRGIPASLHPWPKEVGGLERANIPRYPD